MAAPERSFHHGGRQVLAVCCWTTFQEAVIAQGLLAPSLRMMLARVGVALLPRTEVGEQQRLHVIPQGPADPEHQLNLMRACPVHPFTLIRGTSDLIQVPASAPITQTAADCDLCVRIRALIAASAGDPAGADRWFAEAVRQGPDLPTAFLEWGQTLLVRGDLAGATKQLTLAHEKGPHFADPMKASGDVLVKQGRPREALGKYDEALRYAPNWTALKVARDAAAKQKS